MEEVQLENQQRAVRKWDCPAKKCSGFPLGVKTEPIKEEQESGPRAKPGNRGFGNTVLLEHSKLISLLAVYGHLLTRTAEWTSCDTG